MFYFKLVGLTEQELTRAIYLVLLWGSSNNLTPFMVADAVYEPNGIVLVILQLYKWHFTRKNHDPQPTTLPPYAGFP
jgi:hypothetical protein